MGFADETDPGSGDVDVPAGRLRLPGRLTVPRRPSGVVAFAHGSGSSRFSPRNRDVASVLNRAGIATLLFDLLTEDEAANRANVFDIALLGDRLCEAVEWLETAPGVESLPVGLFGASTGAAAALWAAADPRVAVTVAAVVSRGGRPDLAETKLSEVRAPTLLVVGGADLEVLDVNRSAQRLLTCENRLTVVPGATHLFEEPGALAAAADAARDWFAAHFPGD